jgi:hypothetical protein
MAEAMEDIKARGSQPKPADDLREAIAWDMARVVLGLDSLTLLEGDNPEEMGKLANVIYKLLRLSFKNDKLLRKAFEIS